MNLAKIGIVPLWDSEKDSLWMLPGYMEGVIAAGGLPVMMPLTSNTQIIEQLAGEFDGFLFTGGQDVSPELYNEEKSERCGECCEARDKMESLLFTEVLSRDKPVFGICRGIQLINALLGGTLYQDIPSQHPESSSITHRQCPPYDIPSHIVNIYHNTPLHALLGKDTINVNSYHHQAIKDLSPQLNAMASAEDGLVEAVYMPNRKFVWAVQWHPEYSPKDTSSQQLFSAFVDSCR